MSFLTTEPFQGFQAGVRNGKLYIDHFFNGLTTTVISSAANIEADKKYHGVWVCNNGVGTLYLNGVVVAQGAIAQTVTPGRCHIGIDIVAGESSINGDIHTATAYDKALSPEEVRQNFNARRGRLGL